MNLNLKDHLKKLFSHFIKETSKLQFDSNEIKWEKFDFFITVCEEFWKDLMFDSNRKITLNDWFDLTNLVYVRNDFKYLTGEYYWNKLIIRTRQEIFLIKEALQLCPGKRIKELISVM